MGMRSLASAAPATSAGTPANSRPTRITSPWQNAKSQRSSRPSSSGARVGAAPARAKTRTSAKKRDGDRDRVEIVHRRSAKPAVSHAKARGLDNRGVDAETGAGAKSSPQRSGRYRAHREREGGAQPAGSYCCAISCFQEKTKAFRSKLCSVGEGDQMPKPADIAVWTTKTIDAKSPLDCRPTPPGAGSILTLAAPGAVIGGPIRMKGRGWTSDGCRAACREPSLWVWMATRNDDRKARSSAARSAFCLATARGRAVPRRLRIYLLSDTKVRIG